VSGLVLDLAMSATDGASLRVQDQPNLITTSTEQGAFSLSPVAPSESFDVIVSKAGFLDSRNEIGPIVSTPFQADVFVLSNADLNLRYAVTGTPRQPGRGTVIVDVRDDGGNPLGGVPLTDIVLLAGNVPALTTGICVIGPGGVPVPAAGTTGVVNGHALVAILNVAPGAGTLRVVVDGGAQVLTKNTVVTGGGITVARL